MFVAIGCCIFAGHYIQDCLSLLRFYLEEFPRRVYAIGFKRPMQGAFNVLGSLAFDFTGNEAFKGKRQPSTVEFPHSDLYVILIGHSDFDEPRHSWIRQNIHNVRHSVPFSPYRGNPNPRVATMFRWISFVPCPNVRPVLISAFTPINPFIGAHSAP